MRSPVSFSSNPPPGINMHPILDLDQSVRSDVALLRQNPRVKPATDIWGMVLDTATGALREV